MKDLVSFIISEKAKRKKIIKNKLITKDSIKQPKFFTFTFFDYSKELEIIISESNKIRK